MAAKKEKFYIGITTYNMPYTYLWVTQKQYKEMLGKYNQVISDNHATNKPEDGEYYVLKKEQVKDHGTFTEEIIEFVDGATYITLGKMLCKDGYSFK